MKKVIIFSIISILFLSVKTYSYNSNPKDFIYELVSDVIVKLSDKSLDEQALMHLHYALGKAYNDQKEYDLSFKNFKKANNLSKKIQKILHFGRFQRKTNLHGIHLGVMVDLDGTLNALQ